jgi:hypothetical protein
MAGMVVAENHDIRDYFWPRKAAAARRTFGPEPTAMPKHKKDKRTRSVSKIIGPNPQTNPTVAGVSMPEGGGENKAFQQADASRRLGDYESTGNHARTGNRGHQ